MGNNRFIYNTISSRDPVLNHPAVQFQRTHSQLGQIQAIFPSATHTRFHHAGVVEEVLRYMCDVLSEKGRLEVSAEDITQYGKLHDIGHPPFSHAVEYVLMSFQEGKNHKQNLLDILESSVLDSKGRTLADCLEEVNANVGNIISLANKTNPNHTLVTDKSLGADKLGYTALDAHMVNFWQGAVDLQRLIGYMTYQTELGLDVRVDDELKGKPIDMVCAMQDVYFHMYVGVYLSALSLSYERHIQKAVEFGIRGELFKPEEVWDMEDGHLLNRIRTNGHLNENVLIATKALEGYNTSNPYLPAVSLKYHEGIKTDVLNKEQPVEIDSEFGKAFLKVFINPLKLSELEADISSEIGSDCLVSVLPDPDKLNPTDVPLYRGGTKIGSLRDFREEHYKKLEGLARSYFSIRLLVPEAKRDYLSHSRHDIGKLMIDIVNDKYLK